MFLIALSSLLCSCQAVKSPLVSSSSSLSQQTDQASSSSKDAEDVKTKQQTFGFSFVGASLNTSGGFLTVNGLTWDYDAATYMGADSTRGLQIGSKNNPQTESWKIRTDFGETVRLINYEIVLQTASGGNATYEIAIEEGTIASGAFDQTSQTVSDENIVLETNFFAITLQSKARAMYLTKIAFTIESSSDSPLELKDTSSGSSNDEDNPILPGESIEPGKNSIPELNYSAVSPDVYYSGIDFSEANGDKLKAELHDRINQSTTTIPYGSTTSYMLIYTDESVESPGYIYGEYNGQLLPAIWDQGTTWNKEHTWPDSRLKGSSRGETATCDLHNLRATSRSVNSNRGNNYYSEREGSGYYPNEAEDDFRGDVARICFYMATRYTDLMLTDNPDESTAKSVSMGLLSTLLIWNEEDPVSEFEKQRNSRIYCYQGNRNPFIDHPEIVSTIFG